MVAVLVLAYPLVKPLLPWTTSPAVDGPVLTNHRKWPDVPLALIRGPLTLEQGCLLVAGEPVFWQNGTSWDAADQAVILEGGQRVRVGDTFSGGGGHYPAEQATVTRDDASAARLLACARSVGSDSVVFAYP